MGITCRRVPPPPTASISGVASHCLINMHYAQPIKVGAVLSVQNAPLQLGKHRIDEPCFQEGCWGAVRCGALWLSVPHGRSVGRSFPYLAGMFSH